MIASPFTLREWLWFYQALILRDLDRGDTDALTRHVAQADTIQDRIRRDEHQEQEQLAA